ncbi:MAG TPA: metal-dependent transcriptional regulator [Candidatus Polarisedimenticolia bacterium]|nr:metal-dependent transcriptional regulator [Candidatus Polarisedimenticolia bacterium]
MKAPEIERVEELCEEIWSLAEAGQNTAQRLLGGSKLSDPQEALATLRRQGLAGVEGDRVVLTEPGAQIARAVVRRHRLAEVLFSQVLSLEESVSESTACEMEHILSSQVTDSICAYLGHPPRCPHGKPIPQGRCCRSLSPTIKPLVSRLSDLGIGEAGRIVFIAPSSRGSLERVASLGVVPGKEIRLVQRKPAVVFESGCTTIAVDREIAEEIFVRRNPTEA